jgi:hypothetical protein
MQAEKDELNTPAVVTVGIVAAILLFAAIVFLQAYFARAERDEYQRKVVSQRSEELATVQAAQAAQLNGYRWVDRARGIAVIPIDRAMALVARELPSRGEAPATASLPSPRPAPAGEHQ